METGCCEPGSIRLCGLKSVTNHLYSRADTDVKWIKPNFKNVPTEQLDKDSELTQKFLEFTSMQHLDGEHSVPNNDICCL